MWVVAVVLASCQDRAEKTLTPETATVEGYPSLHTVPPRPQLSYPVEQRRAIVDGLVADRENARYTSQVIRYRAGLSRMPPPEPEIVAAVPVEAGPEAADAAAAPPAPPGAPPVIQQSPELTYEGDDLGSFMQDLLNDHAEPAPGGEPEARIAPPGPPAAPGAQPEGARAVPATLAASQSEQAGHEPATTEADGQPRMTPPPAPAKPAPVSEVAEASAPEPREPAVPEPRPKPAPGGAQIEVADGLVAVETPAGEARGTAIGTIAFGPGSAALPADAKARLGQVLGEANAQGARVKIVGEGAAPALALDRAKAVGLALVQGGLSADRLEMTLARDAAGDRAQLFLASP